MQILTESEELEGYRIKAQRREAFTVTGSTQLLRRSHRGQIGQILGGRVSGAMAVAIGGRQHDDYEPTD